MQWKMPVLITLLANTWKHTQKNKRKRSNKNNFKLVISLKMMSSKYENDRIDSDWFLYMFLNKVYKYILKISILIF